MTKINELKYNLLSHSPYSPDLASDFHLSPQLKTFPGGQRFVADEEIKEAVTEYFANLEELLLS